MKLNIGIICLVFTISLSAQSLDEAKRITDTLCSAEMYGRGYVNEGHLKAAHFISAEFEKIELKPYSSNVKHPYFQSFPIKINTFSDEIYLKSADNLVLGEDFILAPFSGSGKGKSKTYAIDSTFFSDTLQQNEFLKQNLKRKIVVYPSEQHGALVDLGLEFVQKAYSGKAVIKTQKNKLTGSLASYADTKPILEVLFDSLSIDKKIKFKVKNELIQTVSQNVIGFIEGSEKNDSFFVFCAHYDHLGGQGGIYFPGANDNATGIAMLLELANHYKQNPPKNNIIFIAFGGEEAGLIGSNYFVKHFQSLDKIKFVLNLDLVATGNKGATVVNGKVFEKEFGLLTKINEEKKYLPLIKSRGEAANSDHYYFSENGIPAFFIYLMGDEVKAYHDIYDTADKLPFSKYFELKNLLIDFVKELE